MRDSLAYLPAAVVPALLALVGSAVFTRLFPPASYGVFQLMGAITGPILSITAQPAAQVANRYRAEFDIGDRLDQYRQAVSWFTVVTVGAMVVLAVLALLLWPLVHSRSVSELVLSGALAGLLASLVYNILTPALMASIQVRSFRAVTIASEALALVLPVLLVVGLGHNVAWLLWGNALAVIAVLPWLVRHADVLRRPRRLDREATATVKRFFAYGTPMALWFFGSSMLNTGDRYVIQAFSGAAAVGLYGANYALVKRGLGLLSEPLLNATGPRLLRQWAAGDRTGVRLTMKRITSLYLMLGCAMVGLIAAIGRPLVSLILARAFLPGAAILVPVTAGSVIWGASRIGHKSIEFVEKTHLMVGDVLAAVAVNMALNILLVPRYGYVAAAYNTLAGFFVYTGLIWWQARALIPWDIPWTDFAAYAAAAAATYVVDEWVVLSQPWPTLLVMGVGGLVSVGLFASFVWIWFRIRRQNPLDWLTN